jgi:7,8-dihydropterin-6-yl-methyl-4-(beta-D-ribofuranosyl)aminobenzene 5'-phosphate synthase
MEKPCAVGMSSFRRSGRSSGRTSVFEPIIGPTVDALTAMGVGRIVPAHCSGWKAVHAIARTMPDAFVQPAVGTTLIF